MTLKQGMYFLNILCACFHSVPAGSGLYFSLSQKTLKMLIQDINRNLQVSGAGLYLLGTGRNMFFFQADI